MSKLKDLCEVIVPMRDKPKMFVAEADGIPWCRIEDIQGKYLYGTTSNQFVDKETIDKMNLKVFPAGTVICACTGASIGTYAITKRDLITNQTFAGLVCGEKLYNHYLYYFVKLYTKAFVDKSVGCAQAYITRETFENIELPDIPKKKKKEIVSVLEKIDEKIVNNNAICSNLEAMAKLLYDYWFVQFDFPDENGKPYKSSGGKMVWNDELKREIPEGWEVRNLYHIADFVNGLACQKYRPKDNKHKLPVIKIGEMHNGFGSDVEWARDDVPEKNVVMNGDILFSWSASLEVMLWKLGTGVLNQHIFKVIPKAYDRYYVYRQLSSYIINFVKMADARKTTMGHITTDHLTQSRIAIPPKSVAERYGSIVSPLYEELIGCSCENQQLASLRDFLLPMLMNGQVKVG